MARRILIAVAIVAYAAGVGYVGVKRAREARERIEPAALAAPEPVAPAAEAAPRDAGEGVEQATPSTDEAEPEAALAAATETEPPAESKAPAPTPAPVAAAAPAASAQVAAPAAAAPTEAREAALAPRDMRPPSVPEALAAKATSPSSIALEWAASADDVGVAGYQVFRDGKPLASPATAAAFADEGLRPRTAHCYSVAALDGAGNRSPRSRPACAETPDWAPPTPPPALRAVATSERQVAISWSASTDDVSVASYEVLRGGTVVARLAGTAVTESGLAPAHVYCYAVRALDGAGNASELAGPACATTPDLTPPTAPDALVAEAVGEHAVRARWSPASDDVGVAGYEVLRAGTVVATTADLATTVKGLRPLVEVCLAVRAFDAAGNRSPEAVPACATPPDLTAPTAPRAVTLAATSEQRVELRWAPSQDEVGVASYEVERDGEVVGTTDAARASEAGLAPGQEVCYTIRARDTVGNVSEPSRRACAVMPDLTPPAQAPRFVAAPSSPSNVAFAWEPATDNVGVVAYELRRGAQLVARVDGGAVRTSAAGLAPATRHCFELVALDRAGNRSPATEACATTAEPGVPAGPTAVRAEPKAPTMVVLRWDSSPDPDVVYTVYWDGGKKIGATAATQYTVAGLRSGERRCYRVAAMDPAGKESPRTMETCVAAEQRN